MVSLCCLPSQQTNFAYIMNFAYIKIIMARGVKRNPEHTGYREIFDWMSAQIREGRWNAGDRLPTEAELTRRFGVSRMTVNRAMVGLAELRLVDRRRGAGSFVAESGGLVPLFAARDVAAELQATREGFSVRLLAHGLAAPPPGLPIAPEAVIHSALVYATADGPVQLEERWVNADLVPAYRTADLTRVSSFSLLAGATADEVDTELAAVRPTRREARLLETTQAQPCHCLTRTHWHRGELVAHSRILSRGDRYTLRDKMRL